MKYQFQVFDNDVESFTMLATNAAERETLAKIMYEVERLTHLGIVITWKIGTNGDDSDPLPPPT